MSFSAVGKLFAAAGLPVTSKVHEFFPVGQPLGAYHNSFD
jgi:hypothetical protein